jgi:hypothetical protein
MLFNMVVSPLGWSDAGVVWGTAFDGGEKSRTAIIVNKIRVSALFHNGFVGFATTKHFSRHALGSWASRA